VDLTLTGEQRALQEGIREFLAGTHGPDRLRALAAGATDGAPGWPALAELGVFTVTVPEVAGGMGLGLADAVILLEELGASLVPGPLVATVLAAGLVDGAASGEAVVTALDLRDPVRVVEHLDTATHVVAFSADGLYLVTPEALAATPLHRPLDPLTPVAAVPGALDLTALGAPLGGPAEAADWITRGTLLTAALQVGVARGALDLAVRYAGERTQFGRVIGGFQAVKHLLAESLARVDLARATVLVAALTADDPEIGGLAEAVSAAKVLADDAAARNGRCCVQVHGGMGFTWEVLAHLFLKRAWLLETCYGAAGGHAAALAAAI
jgi:alkylation response protein AidB-like acyl-CoA dehydrogenase